MRVEKRTADLRTANVKLQNVIEERKRLETELLEIAENERRRIGFDLHDDLGQKLTGISLMLKGLEQTLAGHQHPCCRDARKIQSLLDELIRHTHNLAHDFSALDAKGDDLPTVLRELAETVHKTFIVPCEVSVKGTVPDLPSHTSVQLYKIAQEAISNAIKHGKATQLWLGLTCSSSKLIVTIKNNGRPFSPPAAGSKRMGLRIMNFRANTIGAALEIKPAGRSGTLVTCTLAVSHDPKPAKTSSEAVSRPVTRRRSPRLECVEAP
jgi:signal transduction histidine kinase